jgi:N-acetyl-gamma-glutamyl-phosphate reductase
MGKIKVGVIGGAGYTGGELLRILVNHPNVELTSIHSNSNAGNLLSDVHNDLIGDTDVVFTNKLSEDIDVLFLCAGHGKGKEFFDNNDVKPELKIIDLSHDYRLKASNDDLETKFVYGLPELQRDVIKEAKYIANPGCFATCIQLGLLPLAKNGAFKDDIHISATTGSTGAGQGLSATSHFSWRNNNLSIYKAFEHQHLGEIGESLVQLQGDFDQTINFIPYRGDFTRGIFATLYTKSDLSEDAVVKMYKDFYKDHPFVHVSEKGINLKQVVNTNKCMLQVEKKGDNILISSCIDNLIKGASGQAVQNMNLIFGLEETVGVKLKASFF